MHSFPLSHRRCLLFWMLAIGAFCSPQARGIEFTLDPDLSFLAVDSGWSLSGTGQGGFAPQFPGSMTLHFGGSLQAERVKTTNRINAIDGVVQAVTQPGSFDPLGTPADAAWFLTDIFGPGSPASLAARQQFWKVTGNGFTTPNSAGDFPANVNSQLYSEHVDINAGPLGILKETWNLLGNGVAAANPNISTVGDTLRLTIPISYTAYRDFGADLKMTFTGQLVATAPVTALSAPVLRSGGFEGTLLLPGNSSLNFFDWSQRHDTPNHPVGYSNPADADAMQPTEGLHVAFVDATQGKSEIFQSLTPLRSFDDNLQMQAMFDVGNWDADETNLYTDAADSLVSVQAFFAFDGAEFIPIGEVFSLSDLSQIQDGAWLRNQSLILDTSQFSDDDLRRRLNFVLHVTSGSQDRHSIVLFDNVRLTAVPEPSSVVLGLLGGIAVGVCAWRRR